MIRLHVRSAASSSAVVAGLEQAGAEYAISVTDPQGGEPELEDGVVHLSGAAAILLWLGDRFPASSLVPAVGSVERAHVYMWITWLANTVQTTRARLDLTGGPTLGDDVAATVRAAAADDLHTALGYIDAQLASRTFLVGTETTAADLLVHMLTSPHPMADSAAPPRYPALAAHHDVMERLPAVLRTRQRLT